MNQDTWASVDAYFSEKLIRPDDGLEAALRASDAAGLPAINISPTHGKLLNVLARTMGARRILEVGTLGGYSTIWLARALPPDGRLITLELDDHHAAVARANLRAAYPNLPLIVSISGPIGFVGLLVPHAMRRLVGRGHGVLIAASAMAGAGFLVASDTLARMVGGDLEVPVGIVTALLGGPVFLVILLGNERRRSAGASA